MILGRAEVLGAVRVAKLLDRARDPRTPLPEATTAEVKAKDTARRLRNGRGICYDGKPVLEKEDGHDGPGVPRL